MDLGWMRNTSASRSWLISSVICLQRKGGQRGRQPAPGEGTHSPPGAARHWAGSQGSYPGLSLGSLGTPQTWRTGGGCKLRAGREPRKLPTSPTPFSQESCVSQTRPSKDKGRLHELKGGGRGTFKMTFSSRKSLYRRGHGNQKSRDLPEATEQNSGAGVQARAPFPSPGLCHVAAEAGLGSYSHSGTWFLWVTHLF